jgi:hypothetical protein
LLEQDLSNRQLPKFEEQNESVVDEEFAYIRLQLPKESEELNEENGEATMKERKEL